MLKPLETTKTIWKWVGGYFVRLADQIHNWPITRLLEGLSKMAIILVVLAFILDASAQRETRIVQAWGLVTTTAPGNTGKREALEFLNDSFWPFPDDWPEFWPFKKRVPLVRLDISARRNAGVVFLNNIDLRNAILFEASFGEVDLRNSRLAGARLGRADFSNCSCGSVDFRDIYGVQADFSEASLGFSRFNNAALSHVSFEGANIFGTDYSNADLDLAGFQGTHIREARFDGSSLEQTVWDGAFVERSVFRRSKLKDITFRSTRIFESVFDDIVFETVTFSQSNLSESVFSNLSLRGAKFFGTNLSSVTFDSVADIEVAEFRFAWAWIDAPPKAPEGILSRLWVCRSATNQDFGSAPVSLWSYTPNKRGLPLGADCSPPRT